MTFFYLPDSPQTARFLSASEREFAALRPYKFQRTTQTKSWDRGQFIEALKDVKSWWFFLFSFVICVPNGGTTSVSIISHQKKIHKSNNSSVQYPNYQWFRLRQVPDNPDGTTRICLPTSHGSSIGRPKFHDSEVPPDQSRLYFPHGNGWNSHGQAPTIR